MLAAPFRFPLPLRGLVSVSPTHIDWSASDPRIDGERRGKEMVLAEHKVKGSWAECDSEGDKEQIYS